MDIQEIREWVPMTLPGIPKSMSYNQPSDSRDFIIGLEGIQATEEHKKNDMIGFK